MFKIITISIVVLAVCEIRAQEIGYSKVDDSVENEFSFCLQNYPNIPKYRIRIRKRKQLIPLTTIPSMWNLFRPKKKWNYTINISTKTITRFAPILYDSLSNNAQLGVLSHELAHVSDFHNSNRLYLIKVFFSHLSKRKIDTFENKTDYIAIQRGMGKYLLAWSQEVRQKLSIKSWQGTETSVDNKSERYMSPSTICSHIKKMPQLYPKNLDYCSDFN